MLYTKQSHLQYMAKGEAVLVSVRLPTKNSLSLLFYSNATNNL